MQALKQKQFHEQFAATNHVVTVNCLYLSYIST